MNDSLTPLECMLTAMIDKNHAKHDARISALETQVAMLLEERQQMRSMLDFFEQLTAGEDSSTP